MADPYTHKNDASTTVGTFAVDTISSVIYPLSKITLGALDSDDGPVSATNPMPAGGNTAADGSGTENRLLTDASGHLQIDVLSLAGTVTVDGSGVTQPISAASLPLPSGASTAANQSTGNIALAAIQTAVEGTLAVDGSGVTQPVDLGSNNDVQGAVAEGAAVSGNPFLIAGDDGTNVKHIAVASDGAVHIDDGGNSITIDGNVGITGDLPDTSAGDLAAINSAVSGTLTVGSHAVTNAGTFVVQEDGAALTALSAIQTAVEGTLTVGSHAVTNAGTFAVQESRAHTADFDTGGGTDTTAAFGIAVPASGGAAVVPGDATNGLTVNLGSNNDVAQSGTWNITNISGTVSLPTGAATAANQSQANAYLSVIQSFLAVMDDWDESDRCAVNPISGQTGVAAGSGAVGATTQRVTLATDVALPSGSNTLGKVDHPTTGFGDGVKTVTTAGTAEALAGSTDAKWVTIQAQTDNTNYVAVGASGVDATIATGTGALLSPGQKITLPCDNLSDVFVDSLVDGEGVRYIYGT